MATVSGGTITTDTGHEGQPSIRAETPAERAMFYFVRAKRLYAAGGEYGVILERHIGLFPIRRIVVTTH